MDQNSQTAMANMVSLSTHVLACVCGMWYVVCVCVCVCMCVCVCVCEFMCVYVCVIDDRIVKQFVDVLEHGQCMQANCAAW